MVTDYVLIATIIELLWWYVICIIAVVMFFRILKSML